MAVNEPERLASMEEVADYLQGLLKNRQRLIVAISGFGGSGKSYLANQLQQRFDINPEQVVRIDHLSNIDPDGPGIFDQFDGNLLRRILRGARSAQRLKYCGRTYWGRPVEIDEEFPRILIVEGIRLLQPDLMPYFDVSVWINCPHDFALQRAKERDRQQGEDEREVNRWDTEWGPKDKAYFKRFRPDKMASLLYDGYQPDDVIRDGR